MKIFVAAPLVVGLSIGLMAGEMYGENQPHAEFLGVAPTLTVGAFTNVTSAAVISSYNPEKFAPAEWKVPQDHLVIQTADLTVPPPPPKIS